MNVQATFARESSQPRTYPVDDSSADVKSVVKHGLGMGDADPKADAKQDGFTTSMPKKSVLVRRKSRQEEQVATESFIKNMAGATSVRKHLKDDSSDLHLQNKFNKQEFFTSLVYETLPPVILSPLFAVFMEGPERAYHLVNHRLFLPVDKSYQKDNPGLIVFWWIVFIPILHLVQFSVWSCFFYSSDLGIDIWEGILAFFTFVCRNMILSIKYAYYSDEELEGAHQTRKLIGAGWRFPLEHQGLVEEELKLAQELIDVHLGAPSFKLENVEAAQFLRNFDCHEDFKADNGHNEDDEVSAAFIVHQFVRKCFGNEIPFGFNAKIANFAPLVTALIPNLLRLSSGQWAFGETHWQKSVHAGLFVSRFFFFAQLFLFGYIAVHDFMRRKHTMKLLGRMTTFPGVRLDEFLTRKESKGEKKDAEIAKVKEKEKAKKELEAKKKGTDINSSEKVYAAPDDPKKDDNPADPAALEEGDLPPIRSMQTSLDSPDISGLRVYIDLREGANAFSWVLARRAVKAFGSGYYSRIQAYIGVLFLWSVFAMISLNGLFWSSQKHSVNTIYYLCIVVFTITVCVLTAVGEATKLQEMVTLHRMILKNEIFAIDQTLSDNALHEENVKKGLRSATKKFAPSLDERLNNDDGMKGPPSSTISMKGPPAQLPLLSPFRKNTPKPQTFQELTDTSLKLEHSKRVLKTADDLIGYQEEIHMPVNVMGVHATNGVYNTTIGILLTLAVLAVEGFSSGGLKYDAQGWATYEQF
ncbi:hypothetical protein TrLO_g12679 [Triparma laevis f. longispina]|uniref:Uncharacterized protein n=1 Tax=Triparma laevis f. longispina TaxID=1714387 RepID=A0A9W6ZSP7_9STRA|nr:hypothetical protein TrLO_g12679 [Triparma laevis f. longispina]